MAALHDSALGGVEAVAAVAAPPPVRSGLPGATSPMLSHLGQMDPSGQRIASRQHQHDVSSGQSSSKSINDMATILGRREMRCISPD
ncbi:MAG: hypothetical protein ACJ8AW_21770 [Rhodopila sp.]